MYGRPKDFLAKLRALSSSQKHLNDHKETNKITLAVEGYQQAVDST